MSDPTIKAALEAAVGYDHHPLCEDYGCERFAKGGPRCHDGVVCLCTMREAAAAVAAFLRALPPGPIIPVSPHHAVGISRRTALALAAAVEEAAKDG